MSNKLYRLSKSRHILHHSYSIYKKRKNSLPAETKRELEELFPKLEAAILANDRTEADALARNVEAIASIHLRKGPFEYILELGFALIFALIIATIVRQMWFELYEIPTGSMRPTFKEQDRLTVTKTAFGINIPLMTKHFYFDPDLVQRTSIVIFSGDNIGLQDTDTTYFMIFPAKKRYIKRLIGKPGDSIYFYGGKLYGVDKKGLPIEDFNNAPWMERLDHIPFLSFDGRAESPRHEEILFKQMNETVGRLRINEFNMVEGQVLSQGKWIADEPLAAGEKHDTIKTYSDFFGMRNFAMARLLTKAELAEQELDTKGLGEGELYLELSHTPGLTYPHPLLNPSSLRENTIINTYRTVIPVKRNHLDKIMDNMYTARFVVRNNYATRYAPDDVKFYPGSPKFSGVPNGTYEFYYGKAWEIGWGGISYAQSSDNPLYQRSAENIQKLFNLGIDLSTYYSPVPKNKNNFPHRYAYFYEGDLYLLGAPIFTKDDPLLIAFNEREKKRAQTSSTNRPYIPFKDWGPPLKDGGELDVEFIRTFGVQVPEGHYLVLGDNHAMSADSRIFGFVPQANLEGAPCLIIWPPGDNIGRPAQKPYPFINGPRLMVWSIVLVIVLIGVAINRRNMRRPIVAPHKK